ncbi:hypothetical protein DPEC_G00152200 [Dallia pectoralis]|uniref:Uncharacterized protein n=1 Tax=Dallia pectoralis TaxID=75939 RepID=A0ACC2GK30_DALPE|nr:hypothetical protein DPEC_G00152200 [Dallia pectoralis]
MSLQKKEGRWSFNLRARRSERPTQMAHNSAVTPAEPARPDNKDMQMSHEYQGEEVVRRPLRGYALEQVSPVSTLLSERDEATLPANKLAECVAPAKLRTHNERPAPGSDGVLLHVQLESSSAGALAL